MDVDQETTVLGRDDLGHPDGHGAEQHPGAHAGEKAEGQEHADIDGACQTCPRDEDENGGNGDGHLSPPSVTHPGDHQGADEGARLEETVHGGDDVGRIRAGVQLKVGEK